MSNWYAADPSRVPPFSPERARQLLDKFEGWSIPELMRGERFAQSTSNAPSAAMSSPGASADPTMSRSQPDWLTGAQWREMPARLPELSPPVDENPFAALRRRQSAISDARRPRPIGPPFLNEPPQDYPSYLGPVPRAPNWEQVVPGDTPWSPLASPRRATDWGKVLNGIECRRTEDGKNIGCITPGGRRFTVPAEDFPDYIGPGEPDYHYYNRPVGRAPVDTFQLMQRVINNPTPGPRYLVRPATPEGTSNEATPSLPYHLLLGGNRLPLGTTQNPVMSYLTRDQTGALMVVNVTRPGHGLRPGIVARYVTGSPAGATIQNEGAGLGWLQAPGGLLSDTINSVWDSQSRELIDQQLRRRRR
jgi:hypothetical protein